MSPDMEKQGLCAQNIPVHILVRTYLSDLHFCTWYQRSVSFVRFSMLSAKEVKISTEKNIYPKNYGF